MTANLRRVHGLRERIAQTSSRQVVRPRGAVREGVRVREISNEEGQRLLRIVRRSSGSVVTWRRAQMVLLSARGMDVAQMAKVAYTSEDRVRAVLHNFNDDGFDSLYPWYAGAGHRPSPSRSAGRSRRSLLVAHRITACRSRPGRWPGWLSIWSPRGWSTTSVMRAFGSCSERRASFQAKASSLGTLTVGRAGSALSTRRPTCRRRKECKAPAGRCGAVL